MNKMEIGASNNHQDLHKKLHAALKSSDLSEVKKLTNSGVQLRYEIKEENCYFLAQDNKNPKFLEALLKYNVSGVNAINFIGGESLLLRDIQKYRCRHAELLIYLGADVNYKTSSGETPLLALLRIYDKVIHFKILKLLVDSGADLNGSKDYWGNSALMIAASLEIKNADLNLIKYLIEHGAKGGADAYGKQALNFIMDKLPGIRFFNEAYRTDLIHNYFIPAVDLLIEAGDDLFGYDNDDFFGFESTDNTPLSIAIKNEETTLAVHLAKIGFEIIQNGFEMQAHEIHPLLSILNSLAQIIFSNGQMYSEISNLIFSHSNFTNNFIKSENHFFKNNVRFSNMKITLFSAPLIQWSLRTEPLNLVVKWYQNLIENNILLCDEDRSVLLTIFLIKYFDFNEEISKDFMAMLNYLIDTLDVNIGSLSSLKTTKTPVTKSNEIKELLHIPECIFIFALHGKVELLKKFLPYWNQNPVAVLLCMRPWLEDDFDYQKSMTISIVNILPLLFECGGPLSHGTKLYTLMEEYILEWRSSNLIYGFDPDELILKCLENYLGKQNPVSLQYLCRTVIRENAIGYGNDLPNEMKSLVSGTVLEDFLALTEKYKCKEFSWSQEFIRRSNYKQQFDYVPCEPYYDDDEYDEVEFLDNDF